MKLPFGIYQGKFVHISEVNSGRTIILCPYCQQKLMAKKGRIKRHHFAHDGVGCTQHFAANFFDISSRLPHKLSLSVYAFQKLGKIQKYYQELKSKQQNDRTKAIKETQLLTALDTTLKNLKKKDKTGAIVEIMEQVNRFTSQKIAPFPAFYMIQWPQFKNGFTDGKRRCNYEELTSDLHEYFYPIAFEPYVQFLKNYHRKVDDYKEIATKLALFEKDLAYFKQFELYFIEIIADHQKIYKIGLTSRGLEKRMKEIKQDLSQFFLSIEVKPLFQVKGYAFLETFFKHKYQDCQLKIGQLTEYFSFSKAALTLILKDLDLLNYPSQPKRNQPAWIIWVFYNFSGKIYGYREKSVYVDNSKFLLTKVEAEELTVLIQLKEKVTIKSVKH
ncbi:MAG: GIY-YIG nuclease family protein [Saprospiraceae bacterium]